MRQGSFIAINVVGALGNASKRWQEHLQGEWRRRGTSVQTGRGQARCGEDAGHWQSGRIQELEAGRWLVRVWGRADHQQPGGPAHV